MKEKLLKTPQGAESIFLEEAYKHEKINETLNDLYTSWGYLPIKTPVFDYYETYEKLLSETSKQNCFRLMDREGDLLLLRNDITLFLARQLGRVLKEEDRALRVHYADSILRHQSEIDISSNEFFQTGAELVGSPGIYGDLEAITLLHTIISDLELSGTRIHVGSRSLFDSIVSNFSNIDSKKLISLINTRDEVALINYLKLEMDEYKANEITKIFMFIGTYQEFIDFTQSISGLVNKLNIGSDIEYLLDIGKNLKDLNIVDDFRLDLSEVANRSYYTGIVFKAYTPGVDSAIATGGRYDNLISSFGKSIPSVGFSILLRKIENKITNLKFLPPKMQDIAVEDNFVKAYKKAQQLRKDGSAAVIRGEK